MKSLNDFLDALGRILRLRLRLEGAILLAAATLTLFLVAALAFSFGAHGRYVGTLFWGVWALAWTRVTWRFFLDPAVGFWQPHDLAAYAERHHPALNDRLLSATELGAAPPAGASPALIAAYEQAVAEEAAKVSPHTLAPKEPLQRALAWLGAAALLVGLACALWPYPTRGAWLALWGRYTSPGSGAPTEFLAGDIRVHYRYPAYTGLEPQDIPASSGDIEAYPGTEITLSVRSRHPASEAFLRLDPGGRLSMRALGDDRFEASFVMREGGSYRFVFDEEEDTREHRLVLRPDRVPNVTISAPSAEIEVRETDQLTLDYRADDDFGLGSASLVFEYAQGEERRTDRRALPKMSGKSVTGRYVWDLAPISFTPGDRVTYYLEVSDNDTVNGPKLGRSATQTLKVFSVQDHHKSLLDKENELFEAWLGLLAKYLEQPVDPAAIPNDKALLAAVTSTADEHRQQAVEPLAYLAKELKDDPLATDVVIHFFTEALADFSALLKRYEQIESGFARNTPAPVLSVSPWPFMQAREQSIARLERGITELSEMLQKQKYDAMVSESDKLASMRDELRQLLDEYKRHPDEATKARIEQKLKELRDKMQALMEHMSQIKQEVPEEFLNLDAMPTQNIMENLDQLDSLLKSGDTDKLAQEFETLSHDLNGMLDNLKKGSEDLGDNLYSESAAKLENMRKDLDQLIAQEQSLNLETERQDEAWRQQIKDKRPAANKLRELIAKAEHAKRELTEARRLPSYLPDMYREQPLDAFDNLARALQAQDIASAAESARLAADLSKRLESAIGPTPHPESDPREQLRRHAEAADHDAQEILKELEGLAPNPQQLMSQDQKDALSRLSKRQNMLQGQGQSLRQQIDEMGQGMPFMPGNSGELMNDAVGGMQQATQELGGLKPGSAGGQQRRSVNGLKTLRQGIDQALQQMQNAMKYGGMRPMRGGQGQQEGANGKMDKQKVEIPQGEEQGGTKVWREELLDAMKRKAPESYDPQNRLYYKELVK